MEESITILEALKNAKQFYLDNLDKNIYFGMCYTIKESFRRLICERISDFKHRTAMLNRLGPYMPVYNIIPEFNLTFLQAYEKTIDSWKYVAHDSYWWDIKDSASRLRAFDKLISVYEEQPNKTI